MTFNTSCLATQSGDPNQLGQLTATLKATSFCIILASLQRAMFKELLRQLHGNTTPSLNGTKLSGLSISIKLNI